jgi:glycopeptide antibiotics resistance protein
MPPRSKSPARLLWVLFAGFIVYGTAFPFRFRLDSAYLKQRIESINWFPLVFPSNPDILLPDYLQNILLFAPFGFLGYVAVNKQSRWKPALLILLGCAFSTGVEFLQLFSKTRFTALTDVIWNTLGTALGVWAGMRLRSALIQLESHPGWRGILDAEAAYPTLLFGLAATAGAWQPFDFSLSWPEFSGKIAMLAAVSGEVDFTPDNLLTLSRFACFSLFACRLFSQAGRGGLWAGPAFAWFCGMAMEAGQFIVQSRTPDLRAIILLTLGVGLGFAVSLSSAFRRHSAAWGALILGAFAAAIAIKNLHPFHLGDFSGSFNWIPFLPYYRETSFRALADFLQEGTAYFSVGALASYLFSGKAKLPWLILGVVPFAFAIEVLQLSLPGSHADITHVIGAAAGALAGHLAMARGWSLYREYVRPESASAAR